MRSDDEADKDYKKQCVAYIDFLGVTEAAYSSVEKARVVLKILKDVQALKSNFEYKKLEHGGYSIKPAISAFSDNLVISFSLEDLNNFKQGSINSAEYHILDHLRYLLGTLAAKAISNGFLIRGGISSGRLYHRDGVIFGEALVDAYKLESEIAIYPRIAISPRISNDPSWRTPHKHVARDADGVSHLNYFLSMAMIMSAGGNDWVAHTLGTFQKLVGYSRNSAASLEKEGKIRAASKWSWLAHTLDLERRNFKKTMDSIGRKVRKSPD